MTSAHIAGIGTALPGPPLRQHDLWTGRFAEHFAGDRTAERIFLGAGVATRHAAVNPVVEDASGWSTGARMRRYLVEALPLGKDAVAAALADAGLAAEDVGLFAVATCTGYATPGLDIRIAADLGMAPDLQRVLVGHMGCYAAVPGLSTVTDYVVSHRRPAVLLCCELTSLHVQPPIASTAGRWCRTRSSATRPRPSCSPRTPLAADSRCSTSRRSPTRAPPTT